MILVTGGCGYIGSHIVKSLSELGEKVIVFDSLVNGRREALLHNEILVEGDITNRQSLDTVFAKYRVDLVIHCAALVNAAESVEKSALYLKVNGDGSQNVWQAALNAGVKHFIYTSSAAVHGTPQSREPVKETDSLVPTSPYGEGKFKGEESLRETVKEKGTFVILRFFNVAGAESAGRLRQNRESRAIMERLFAVAKGLDLKLVLSGTNYDTDDGSVVRDFIHVEDIVSGVLASVNHLRGGGASATLNLGTGIPTSMLKLHALAEEVTGKEIPLEPAPRNPGDISYSLADISLAKNVLNWTPTHSVKDMLKDGYHAYLQA